MTDFWAAVCTHFHGDHVGGLIKLVQDPSFTFQRGGMHDIRNHLAPEALRRATAGRSQQAQDVKEVLENTKVLASAFDGRRIPRFEPFTGAKIADFPPMTVLGPGRPFYKQTIEEFTNVEVPVLASPFWGVLSGIGPGPSVPLSTLLYAPAAPVPGYRNIYAPALPLSTMAGALKNSSVEKSPSTQPYNNTSVILGVVFDGKRFMFTADAGSDSLDRVHAAWKSLWWMQVPHHGSDGNLSQANIERFCPTNAYISACGDTSHPDRAIVNGLIKVRSTVYSTHMSGHLNHHQRTVPARSGYSPAVPLKGTAEPVMPIFGWSGRISDMR